jgi:hypothetical protein
MYPRALGARGFYNQLCTFLLQAEGASAQQLEVEHRFKADNAYVSAIKASSTQECDTFSAEYELNRKLSETYRMMALRAHEYAKQFSNV